jgi:hypothetical protein
MIGRDSRLRSKLEESRRSARKDIIIYMPGWTNEYM